MKAADATCLMTSRAGYVVEPLLEVFNRANVAKRYAVIRGLLQRCQDVALSKYRTVRIISLHESGRRSQVRSLDRRCSDHTVREKSFGYQNGAPVQFPDLVWFEQPSS